jgi:PAS domain S-box-containing protein
MAQKILIIDEEQNNLDLLHDCLHKAGFKILIAKEGSTALQQVNQIKTELILLAVMPKMEGFEICRRLKENDLTKEIPIIFLISETQTIQKNQCFESGAVDYLCQPFDEVELIARVNKHLTMCHLQKQLEEKNAQLQEHVYHLSSLDSLRKGINETHDVEQMMENAMKVTLSVFNCDRAWLLYPCDPNASNWRVPIESTRPEYPGAKVLNQDIPMIEAISEVMKTALLLNKPMTFGDHYDNKLPPIIVKQFSVQSQLCLALYPKMGKPWLFGLHQCAYAREWTENEITLFRDFGHHISQSLCILLSLEELQKSQEQFKGYFESALVGFAISSLERQWIYVNDCMCKMLGYSQDELKNLSWEQLSYSEDLAAETLQFEQLLRGEIDSYTMDKRFVHKNGSIVYVFLSVSVRYQKNKTIEYIVATLQDITERKKAEKALFQSKEQFRKIFEEGPIGMVIATPNLDLIKVNPAFCEMLGYTEAELLQLNVLDITYPEDMITNRKLIDKAIKNGEVPYQQEKRYIRKDGQLVWGNLAVSFFYNEKREVTYFLGKIEDITERKKAEKALQDSYNCFTTVTNSLEAIVYVSDFDNNELLFINQYGKEILGNQRIKKSCWHVTEQTEPCSFCNYQEKGKENYNDVWEFQDSLNDKWYLCRAQAIQWPDGRLVRMEVATDITERKENEIALIQAKEEADSANRLKSEFLANMSHELRTPLNTVLVSCELLLDNIQGELNEKQQKLIEYIQTSGNHLLSLITDILDLSKIEAGQMKLDINPLKINTICQDSLQFVIAAAKKKQLQLLKIEDSCLTTIQADERALKQILINLLSNAIKFTPNCGRIILEIKGDKEKRVAKFSVTDTGIGFPENEIEGLFQPFVQLDGSLSRKQEGTGLGLALVYKLTQLHGGSITVESEMGKGSRFEVSLPWQEDENFPPVFEKYLNIETPTVSHSHALILLAEDNESNIMSIQNSLQARGYQILVARDGAETIRLSHQKMPALILMDIQMPKVTGIEAIEYIRNDPDLYKIPIIALTALAMQGDQEKCLEAGANAYFSKPINIKRLIEEIEKLLSNKQINA